ncbi:MAG: hypothetical protein H2038_10215 [Brevundimonas sp.]|jgi:hypothetical protein|uniref:hypothetical protein n=1 Tax=Brevundimonas sp. TaxID=1871086 RepID=UPI0017A54517|nr:hypothetical protein [Brevundimonas sp.]MBA4805013.1 hypothetical protein [Brevundimonas sp.]
MAGLGKTLAVVGLGLGLSGCSSDPEFWETLSHGLDTLAYELENQPVCTWYTDRFGVVRQYCEPAWQANQRAYATPVYVAPVYVAPDRQDRRHGDRRDHRRRRDENRGGRRGW